VTRPITPSDIIEALYESDGDMYTEDPGGNYQNTVIDGSTDLNQAAALLNRKAGFE
jgi:hypothetical protein